MTIEDFLRLLLRNALLLILGLLLGGAAGYAFSYTKDELYTAQALGYVTTRTEINEDGEVVPVGANAPQAGGDEAQYGTAQTFLPLFNTRAVGDAIVKELGLEADGATVASSLSAEINPNAPIITVTATAGSPQAAMEIANASLTAVNKEGAYLMTGDRESNKAPMVLVQYQTASNGQQVAPDRIKYGLAGAAAGLLLAFGIAWLRNRNDSRIRTVDDIRLNTPVAALGVLPQAKDLVYTKTGRLPEPTQFHTKEALRKFRTNLRFASVDNPPHSIVVTSSAPSEGKSTVAANLARVIAASGQSVVLIDADLRRPVVAEAFGLEGSVGLSQLIAGLVEAEDAVQPTDLDGLSIIPAGQIPPNPSELLGSQKMHDIVQQLSLEHFVIIDAPPVLAVTDAVLLSRHCDGAIIVAVSGKTRVDAISRSIDAIRSVHATVLGVVMNRASTSKLSRLAYGDAEYGYLSYKYAGYVSRYDSQKNPLPRAHDEQPAREQIRPAEQQEHPHGAGNAAESAALGPRAQARRALSEKADGQSATSADNQV